jgi:hypothetical protein
MSITRRSALLASTAAAATAAAAPAGPRLAHNVFFSLKERTPAARQRLIEACHKYLKPHPGVVFFAAGSLADDLAREVNDRDFDVSLHVVFDSRASHDKYQTAELHLKFIAENQASWAKVRVFDSLLK